MKYRIEISSVAEAEADSAFLLAWPNSETRFLTEHRHKAENLCKKPDF
jgi:hypothetical protein